MSPPLTATEEMRAYGIDYAMLEAWQSTATRDVAAGRRTSIDPRFLLAIIPVLRQTLTGGTAAEPTCTGLTATWCPVHGSCDCHEGGEDTGERVTCPLHGIASNHAASMRDELQRMPRP